MIKTQNYISSEQIRQYTELRHKIVDLRSRAAMNVDGATYLVKSCHNTSSTTSINDKITRLINKELKTSGR